MKKPILFLLSFVLLGCTETITSQTLTSQEPVQPAEAVVAEDVFIPKEAVAEIKPSAARLLDYTPRAVFNWLGTPSLLRRDTKVQVAQFTNTHCVLDVYFYRPSEQMDFLANHVDARTLSGADFSEDECLLSLFNGKPYPQELLPARENQEENQDAVLE